MSTSIGTGNTHEELEKRCTPSSSSPRRDAALGQSTSPNKYKGIRRRKWGKWVSELRVPGTQERLWLGSYSSPEAAAVAHDVALYCLRGLSSTDNLNFPLMLPSSVRADMSPKSVQRAASDAGMAIDAQMIMKKLSDDRNSGEMMETDYGSDSKSNAIPEAELWEDDACCWNWEGNEVRERESLSISVEDYL